jgi:hypothetical protein
MMQWGFKDTGTGEGQEQGLTSPSSDETHVRIHLIDKLSDSHAFVRHCVPTKAALCVSPVKGGFQSCYVAVLRELFHLYELTINNKYCIMAT